MIKRIGNVYIIRRTDKYAKWIVKLSVARPEGPPFCNKDTPAGKLLDAVVSSIRNINIVYGINSNTIYFIKLTVAGTKRPPLGDKNACACKFLDAVIS